MGETIAVVAAPSVRSSSERLSDVVIFNDFAFVNGGASQVALTSAMALAQRGLNVHLLAAAGDVDTSLEPAGVRVLHTGQYDIRYDTNRQRAAVQGLWNRKAQRKAGALLHTLDRAHTVVHVHGWTKALSSSVVHEALQAGFPVVLTLHDYFSACPNGGFFHYGRRQVCELRAMSLACVTSNCDVASYPQKLWRVVRQAVQSSGGALPRSVRHFVSISALSESILAGYLPKDARIHRIPNPVTVERGSAVEVERNRTFTFVGRLAAEKGPALMAAAAVDAGVESVLVGDGPEASSVRAANAQAKITGWLDAAGVRAHLRAARALVFPSLWYETQGLVVLEAAALGVPAIVPDHCAAREQVIDGVTGLWFKGGDVKDLATKIRRLRDPEQAAKMGRAAYERYWSSPFTVDVHVTRLLALYDEMLEEPAI